MGIRDLIRRVKHKVRHWRLQRTRHQGIALDIVRRVRVGAATAKLLTNATVAHQAAANISRKADTGRRRLGREGNGRVGNVDTAHDAGTGHVACIGSGQELARQWTAAAKVIGRQVNAPATARQVASGRRHGNTRCRIKANTNRVTAIDKGIDASRLWRWRWQFNRGKGLHQGWHRGR